MSNLLQPIVTEHLSESSRKVRQIKRGAASLFQQVKMTWESSVQSVWSGNTAEVLSEMGTNAAEFFRISAVTVAFLEALEPGSTTYGRSLMRPYTVHQDGRITLQ